MNTTVCHDIKTTRIDASKRLPSAFSIVPIVFYLALLIGGYVNVTSYLGYRKSTQDRDTWKQFQAEQQQAKEGFDAEKAGVFKEKNKAEKFAQWIEGTRSLQPISVAIARSLPPAVTIGEMALERSPEIPSQIILTMLINNGSLEELSKVQQGITTQNYRAYNSQQSKTGDMLEFHTMLVWNHL